MWRRLFSLPRRLSSRRLEREPLPPHVSARVPRRQSKRLRHEQLAQCRLKADEKSGLTPAGFRHGNYGTQIRVHRLQLVEFLEHPGPVAGISLGRIGNAKVVVESQDIASQLRRHLRVVALQLVQQLRVNSVGQLYISPPR